jgi:hypothetical protein
MTNKPATAKPDYEHLEASAKTALQSWMAMQRPMFSMMTEINGRLIDQAVRVNKAWIGMVGRRVDHDLQATRRLLGCRNVNDFMTTYRDVVDTAQREAQVEVEHLSRLNREVADETVAAIRDGLKEAAEELKH